MALTLTDIKQYLRIDEQGTLEDALLKSNLKAATALVKEQTGKKEVIGDPDNTAIDDNDLFMTVVKMLVAHWYDNRGVVLVGASMTQLPYAAQTIIHHIALCSEYV